MIHLICPNPAVDRTLLIKNFKSEVPNRPYLVREFAGGKGFNVAYAISFEDPVPTFMVHTILGGRNGDQVKDLASANRTHLNAIMIEENTRVCNIIMDTDSAITYPVYENSFDLDPILLNTFTESLKSEISPGDTIVFSGSLMKGMPSNYIATFIRQYKKNQVKIFVDTSGPALLEAHKERPYAIKINDEEITELVPHKKLTTIDDYLEVLQSDLTKDIAIFIITLGSKGIIGKIHNEFYLLRAKKVDAKNPIACGDFFLGSLVKQDNLGATPIEMLKQAITYSTANVLSWFPELKKENLDDIYRGLEITKL